MSPAGAVSSNFAATRRVPNDPYDWRLRGLALLEAAALHVALLVVLLAAKLPTRVPPEPPVYDLVFVAPRASALPEAALRSVPLAPATSKPIPAPAPAAIPPTARQPKLRAKTLHLPRSTPPPSPEVAEPPPVSRVVAPPAARPEASAEAMAAEVAVPHPSLDPAYAAAVLSRLGRFKEYPPIARERKLEGRVILRLAVARSGHVTISSVERSSGAEVLDDAALAMVRRADPLPPLPKSFTSDVAEFRVPVDFVLTGRE